MESFLLLLHKYGVRLSKKDQVKILDAFPGGNEESENSKEKMINIARIYD